MIASPGTTVRIQRNVDVINSGARSTAAAQAQPPRNRCPRRSTGHDTGPVASKGSHDRIGVRLRFTILALPRTLPFECDCQR